jgi:AhpD family alkylhydroperoxidase
MNKNDREKIEKIIKERKEANDFFISKNSKPYLSFLELEKNTFKSNKLTKNQKELIAVGISVVINCESCMEWHIKEALRSGSSQEEVLEAVEVGIEMGGGPATVSSRFALKVLEYYKNAKDIK